MFNWIGLFLVNEIVYARGAGAMYDAHNTRTWKVVDKAPQALIPSGGMSELFHTSNTTIAIFLAVAVLDIARARRAQLDIAADCGQADVLGLARITAVEDHAAVVRVHLDIPICRDVPA